MLKDCNGKKIPELTERAILRMLAEKIIKHTPFTNRERRRIRMRNSENYRLFCLHDLDISGRLLDTLSSPITRF